jgi:hypothetical protein
MTWACTNDYLLCLVATLEEEDDKDDMGMYQGQPVVYCFSS